MKTMEQVLEAIKHGKSSECLDGRDFIRLCAFVPVEHWKKFGFEPKEGVKIKGIKIRKWSEKNIVAQLKEDLKFAFEKALNKRGISSAFMFDVIKMWMWVLDDPLQHYGEKNYAYIMYGLPLYKAVALKYGFPNPIGKDSGSEEKYNE